MTDNLALGADGQANHTLAVLRDDTREGKLTSDLEFLPGFALHADPEMALSGSYKSPKGRLLEIDAKAGSNQGNWFGLHLSIPVHDLGDKGVLGFVARLSAPDITVARACLRSGTEDGFQDCFFDKHLLFRPDEASHMDVLQVQMRDQLPQHAPWRELILFLPTGDFRLSLADLRVFAV